MPAPKNLGALFFLGLLFISFNSLTAETPVIDLGKIETIVEVPLTTGSFYTQEDIKKSCSLDLAHFLTEKGILVMNTGGTGAASNISIHGYAGFCIKVYIDDVLANNPTTGEFDWNQINLESISSIEIQDFPVENQLQFAGAVIKIKTKSFGSNNFYISSKVLSYESSIADTIEQAAGAQLFTKKSAFKINSNIRFAKNEYLTPLNSINSYNKSKLAQIDGCWNLYTHNGSLSATAFLGTNQIKALNTGTTYDIGVEQDINSRLSFKRELWNDSTWHIYGANYNLVDIEYDESIYTHNSTAVHNLESFYNLDFKDINLKIYNTFINEWSSVMNAYRPQLQSKVSYNFNPFNWLVLNTSLGVDLWCVNNNSSWESLNYEFVPFIRFIFPLGFSLSSFKEFILPTFNQLYWKGGGGIGNPNLNNEYGWSTLLSWNLFPFISISYQNSWYGNKIRWTSNNGILMPENTSHAWYNVITLSSTYKWSFFDYSAAINLTKATLEDGEQIMWVPFISASLSVSFYYKNFTWNATANYTGKRYIQNQSIYGFYDPYLLIDLSQNLQLNHGFSLLIKVSNLLDDRYIYHDNYSAPGRSYSIGIRFQN